MEEMPFVQPMFGVKKGAEDLNARERIAYLRGLLDCMEPEERSTKVYTAVAEALDALSLELEEHSRQLEGVREASEELADEIYELHDAVYELERSVGLESDQDYDDADEEESSSESYISVTCPSCAYSFYYRYEEGKEEDKLICPGCGEEIDRTA